MQKFTTTLMFVGAQLGKAEEAINLYVSLFQNSQVIAIERYGAGQTGPEGTVRHATFALDGQAFAAMDSAGPHAFTFTPSISITVQCESEEEIERVYNRFMEGGSAMMPLDNYGFSRKFAWVGDPYGVSWQLTLA